MARASPSAEAGAFAAAPFSRHSASPSRGDAPVRVERSKECQAGDQHLGDQVLLAAGCQREALFGPLEAAGEVVEDAGGQRAYRDLHTVVCQFKFTNPASALKPLAVQFVRHLGFAQRGE